MEALKESLRPRPRPRVQTGKKTLRNKVVWSDETSEYPYSEITYTIPWGEGYAVIPTVDESGNKLSIPEALERTLEKKLLTSSGNPLDFVTGEELPVFSNEEEANRYAQWRSDTMFDPEAIAAGYQTTPAPDEPEPQIDDRSITNKVINKLNRFLAYTGVKSYKGEIEGFDEGGLTDQMEMFGYTAEGAKKEAEKYTSQGGANTDLTFKEAAIGVGSVLPGIGTAMTISDIEEELNKEAPNYGKIVLLGGSEIVGLIPGLGSAAKSALRVIAKKVGADKVVDALDVPKPKTESEIIAGSGATDYKNRALDKAKDLRRRGYTARQIEEMTGRFTTASPGDYINQRVERLETLRYNKEYLENRTKTVNNKDIIERDLKAIDKEIAELEKKYPTGYIEPKEEIYKFEIPDKGIIIKENNGVINYKETTKDSSILIGDMIPTHKKLFEQYPNLKDVEFYIDPDIGKGAHFNPFEGKLDPDTGERTGSIVFGADLDEINNVNSENFRETFFHELQHAVQHQDYLLTGLEQLGGNPTSFTKSIASKNSLGPRYQQATILKNPKALKLRDEIVALFKKESPSGFAVTEDIIPKNINPKVAKKMANLMRNLEAENYKTYLQTASEIEAGTVGLRAIPTSGKSQGRVSSEVAQRKKIKNIDEFYKTDKKGNRIPGPDNQVEKIIKDIKSKFKPMDDAEVMRYSESGVNFARYALGIDKKLQGFDLFGVKGTTYNEGGTIMNDQMEMAFMKKGGIKDDGMNKDPVSGNNIPPGSMAEEVRDDVPAMLSEGEYVVPADVLRFYGVNFFEDLRNKAKNGLQTMEQNGRIGGTPLSDQDVARNMQQPMGSPQSLQAMRMAQPQQQMMANQGMMVQGFDDGTAGVTSNAPQYSSGWSAATARYGNFQGTSSQQANIEAAKEAEASQKITTMVKHYNADGESVMIQYEQLPGGVSAPSPGQESELAKYPMTEAEYLTFKKGLGGGSGGSGGGGGGGGSTTPTGSSTAWLEGINWSSGIEVQKWADKTLVTSGFESAAGKAGGIFAAGAAVSIANKIAKVNAAAMYQESLGNKDLAKTLNEQAKKFAEDNDSFGLDIIQGVGGATGKNYFKQLQEWDKTKPMSVESFAATTTSLDPKIKVSENIAKERDKDKDPFKPSTVTSTGTGADREYTSGAERVDSETGADTSAAGIAAAAESLEGRTINIGGRNEGGLMASPKKKKKRQPKKGGLAGKK